MTKSVRLVVNLTAAESKGEALANLFKAEFITRSRSEQGCEMYELWSDPEDSDRFSVIEIWQSKADLDTHLGQPWFAKWSPRLEQLLARPAEVNVLVSVED